VLAEALRLPATTRVRDGWDRWLLRDAYPDVLPDFVRNRPHAAMSTATGLYERARLFKPLFARLHRSFGYDLLEPIRRDFDAVLTACNHDLERALAEQANRHDHTFSEHARDLVGAVRLNAKPLWRKLSGPTTRPTRTLDDAGHH
jgi:asparagine synthase (glutamine-hydrolysing)